MRVSTRSIKTNPVSSKGELKERKKNPIYSFSPVYFTRESKMFRSIPSRLSSTSCSLLVLSNPRTFGRNARPNFKSLSLRTSIWQSPAHLCPRLLSVSKSSFSTTQLRSVSGVEKKAKLEEERQGALRRKLKVDPENVTSMSNVIPIFGHRPTNQLTHGGSGNDPDMFLELKSDLVGPLFLWRIF